MPTCKNFFFPLCFYFCSQICFPGTITFCDEVGHWIYLSLIIIIVWSNIWFGDWSVGLRSQPQEFYIRTNLGERCCPIYFCQSMTGWNLKSFIHRDARWNCQCYPHMFLNGCILDLVDKAPIYVLVKRFTLDGKAENSAILSISIKSHSVALFGISAFNVFGWAIGIINREVFYIYLGHRGFCQLFFKKDGRPNKREIIYIV